MSRQTRGAAAPIGACLLAVALLALTACGQSDRPGLAWGTPAAEAQEERPAPAATAAELAPRRAWAGPFVNFEESSVSPDGRYVTWRDQSRRGFAVRDLESNDLHWIVDPPDTPFRLAYGGVFSRDGRQIAFAWHMCCDEPEVIGLAVVDFAADGVNAPRASEPRVIDANPQLWVWPLDWSPDGRWVLGVRYGPVAIPPSLALFSTTGDTVLTLKSFDWRRLGRGSFSPDGRFVAYDVDSETDARHRHIYVVSVDGSRDRRVVGGAARHRLFGWAPDGSLLYESTQGGAPSLWRQPMADGQPAGPPELLRNEIWRAGPIGFAGTTFHYGVVVDRPALRLVDLDLNTGRMLGPPRLIEDLVEGESTAAFAWSPDGTHLGVVSRRRFEGGSGSTLAVRSADGAEISKQRLDIRPWRMAVRWSHDGAWAVTYSSDDRGRAGFYRVRLDTGARELLLRSDPLDGWVREHFDLSRDDATLYFVRTDSVRGSRLVARSLATGEETTVGPSSWRAPVALSPDGTRLATVTWTADRGPAVIVVPTAEPPIPLPVPESGAYRQLFPRPEPWFIESLSWTPDGEALLVGAAREMTNPADGEFWLVPVDGGEARKLDALDGSDSRFARLHPNGRRLALVTGENRGEIWALELGAGEVAARGTSP